MESKKKRSYHLHNYSTTELHEATERIRKGESYRKISVEYDIPATTLYTRIKELVPLDAKRGPKTILTEEEEKRLKKWILDKARLGFPMHPDEVKVAVKKVLDETGRRTVFKDNKPGNKWLILFLKRHAEIKRKNTEVISKGRASVTEEKLREWFGEIRSYLQEHNLCSVLERPESIFNGDEAGFQLCPKSGRLLGSRKEQNFYEISVGHEKENITVLCTFSAAGASVPPMIMLPYKRIPLHLSQSIPHEWSIGRSESGWMVSSTFYEYMANIFYPWCVKNNVTFPVIYCLDGHKSHLSLELSDFCKDHSIILVALYPNSTHITQPCDVSIFKALKCKWREVVQNYKQETQTSLTKANFAPLFKKAFDQLTVESIKNGFRKCGLYPFDENAVNYDQCISTRRQLMNSRNATEDFTVHILLYNDLISTKKFFDNNIEREELKKFIDVRNSNKTCTDSTYLLWKKCMDDLQLFEPSNQEINTNNVDGNSITLEPPEVNTEHSIIEVVCSSDNVLENAFNETNELSNVVNTTVGENNDLFVQYIDENVHIAIEKEVDQNNFDIINIPIMNYNEVDSVNEVANNSHSSTFCDNSKSETVESSILEIVTGVHEMTEIDALSNTGEVGCPSPVSSSNPDSIWEKHLLWPSTAPSKAPKKQGQNLPCVLTSSQFREYHIEKHKEKEKKELEKQDRMLKRKIKQEETEIKKKRLKQERENKKDEKSKITEEKMKVKQEKIARNVVSSRKTFNLEQKRIPLKVLNCAMNQPMDLSVNK